MATARGRISITTSRCSAVPRPSPPPPRMYSQSANTYRTSPPRMCKFAFRESKNCAQRDHSHTRILACTNAVLRTGWIMTLHPLEGTARKLAGALRQPSRHQRDRTFWDSVRKPYDSIWNQASEEGGIDGIT